MISCSVVIPTRGHHGLLCQAIDSVLTQSHAATEIIVDDGRADVAYAFHAGAETLTRDNTILISAVTYRRSLHASLGGFDESLPFDWDWYLRVARAGHAVTHVQRPAVAMRVHPQNMSGESLKHERHANHDRLAAKHGLATIPLKNHLAIALRSPGTPPAVQWQS